MGDCYVTMVGGKKRTMWHSDNYYNHVFYNAILSNMNKKHKSCLLHDYQMRLTKRKFHLFGQMWTRRLSLCLQPRVAACVSMAVWGIFLLQWLIVCSFVRDRVSRSMSSVPCPMKPVSHTYCILEVSHSVTPLDAESQTQYLFWLPPARLSCSLCLCLTLIILTDFFSPLELSFIHGARETSSVLVENCMYWARK